MEKSGQEKTKLNYKGPVVLAVLDGVGLNSKREGNALQIAHTDFLNMVAKKYPGIALKASGEAVGILPGIMGNSEVGHNTMGCGQIIKQGIASIEEAFATGEIWRSRAWNDITERLSNNQKTLHFSGIFSDGNVHSSIDHLERMIEEASARGIKRIRIHLVFDGRDVPPQSEPKYIQRLESFLRYFPGCDYKIASGGGRMVFVADRYQSDWSIVERGWNAIVHGKAEYQFENASDAIRAFRAKDANLQDQYLPPFVIVDEKDQPVGKVEDGDAFVYYDFRADRAIEIAMAFTYNDFPYFDRGYRPDVYFAGMTEYNSDTHVPEHQLVPAVQIGYTLNNFLGERGISQLAISETVKFGHITYYFNGNSYDKAPNEEHIKIESGSSDYNNRPWMKAAEITDAALENMEKYRFVRLNYPNGDMVGHLADMESGIIAMEAIDVQLARLAKKVDELGGILLITADHGNIEELLDEYGQPKTSHTTNLVPFLVYDNTENRSKYRLSRQPNQGLSNIAATIAALLGQSEYPDIWHKSLINVIE